MSRQNFYKSEVNKEDMYIRYIHKLCDLHLQAEDFTGDQTPGSMSSTPQEAVRRSALASRCFSRADLSLGIPSSPSPVSDCIPPLFPRARLAPVFTGSLSVEKIRWKNR